MSQLNIQTKNINYVIEAAVELKKREFPFHLVITGGGPDEIVLKNMVADLGIAEDVTFTGAVYDKNYKMGLYLASDLFIFPSVVDTCGLVVLESAAMGKPSVLIKNSSPAEMAVHNHNAFLSELSAVEIANAIMNALSDSENYKIVCQNAKNELGKTWVSAAEEALKRYKILIGKNS